MELLFKLLKFLRSPELNDTDYLKDNNIFMHNINTDVYESLSPQN